ncbi:MAG TPA: ribonuclease III [Clostridiales bacterium]|nr:ribonuclease III [Clostridiales bacterium]
MKTTDKRRRELLDIQNTIGYTFKDIEILNISLTHSSFANELKGGARHNERLEFLGDSVLNVVISDFLFRRYRNLPEGNLTRLRAMIVAEPSLAYCGRQINIGRYLLLGKGEENTGGRNKDSIIADAVEALIGAVYVDSDFENSKAFVLKLFENVIDKALAGEFQRDYKTELQELLQSRSSEKITYEAISETGPDHDKIFKTRVMLGNKVLGEGKGRSKKAAEQSAAKEALYSGIVKNEK